MRRNLLQTASSPLFFRSALCFILFERMNDIIYKGLENNLRKYRKENGFRQSDVAVRLQLKNTSMISRWENRSCIPDTANLFRLSLIYKKTPDALLDGLANRMKREYLEIEKKLSAKQDSRQK